MYGWINASLESLVIHRFGVETWTRILQEAHCHAKVGDFIRNVDYPDEVTSRLIDAGALVLGISSEEMVELLGRNFVRFVRQSGYETTILSQGGTFEEWLKNLNEPHRLLKSRFPNNKFPEFWCLRDESDPSGRTLILHYYSYRAALFCPMVIGVVKEAGKEYFSIDVSLAPLFSNVEGSVCHAAWRVTWRELDACLLDDRSHVEAVALMRTTMMDTSPSPPKRSKHSHRIHTMSASFPVNEHDHISNSNMNNTNINNSNTNTTGPQCPFSAMLRANSNRAKDTHRRVSIDLNSEVHHITQSEEEAINTARSQVPLSYSSSSFSASASSRESSQKLSNRTYSEKVPLHCETEPSLGVFARPVAPALPLASVSMSTPSSTLPRIVRPQPIKTGGSSLPSCEQKRSRPSPSLSPSPSFGHSAPSPQPYNNYNSTQTNALPRVQTPTHGSASANTVGLSPRQLQLAFPFHVAINRKLQIVQIGSKLAQLVQREILSQIPQTYSQARSPPTRTQQEQQPMFSHKGTPNHFSSSPSPSLSSSSSSPSSTSLLHTHIANFFHISTPPDFPWDWEQLLNLDDHTVEITLVHNPSRSHALSHPHYNLLNETYGAGSAHATPRGEQEKKKISFRGTMVFLDPTVDALVNEPVILFLVNPHIFNLAELAELDLKLSDLPRHNFQRDLLLIGEHLKSEASSAVALDVLSKKLDEESRISQNALKTKRVFVRYVSHEIRTPLNITILGLKYLEDELRSHSPQALASVQDVLVDVKTSCGIAVDILNDLLLYEKLDDGFFNLALNDVYIDEYFREAIQVFSVQAKSLQINLTLATKALEGIILRLDRTKFSQVLRNLISNALKFTPANGRITVSCYPLSPTANDSAIVFSDNSLSGTTSDGHPSPAFVVDKHTQKEQSKSRGVDIGFIRISITDTGPGISKEDQRKIFHEFTQFKPDKLQNGQGSGLGLWIANNIVTLHGGRIGLFSEGEGKGSTFVVDLPIFRRVAVSEIPCPSAANKATSEEPSSSLTTNESLTESLKSKRILIVDDAPTNRKIVRRMLRDRFGHVEEAENGQEAVNKYLSSLEGEDASPFAVVMMDYEMPLMNGLDATKIIKSFAPAPVVVGVTGNGLQTDIDRFLEAGADTVMIKPINIDDFLAFVAKQSAQM